MSSVSEGVKADLQTAQNRMFTFVCREVEDLEKNGTIEKIFKDPARLKKLFFEAQDSLFDLLAIPDKKKPYWHMGIADSGKRSIELLVDLFCQNGGSEENALVATENYVAFNKFSTANALKKQKGIEFYKPFNVKPGSALTFDNAELKKAKKLFEANCLKTLWLAWNSTSTGVCENVERVVKLRNNAGCDTLIIADSASKRLFTKSWQNIPTENYPDVFFFSLRKQGIPYDGPQNEAAQMKNSGAVFVFNERAVQRCVTGSGVSLFETPSLWDIVQGEITQGENRKNHIRHLLKLKTILRYFLRNDGEEAEKSDKSNALVKTKVLKAFAKDGELGKLGFSLMASPMDQSPVTYVFRTPEHLSARDFVSALDQRGIKISQSMHPEFDANRFARFAFYPANTPDELFVALREFKKLAS